MARVKYGQSVTFAAAPGHHDLQLAVDWARSPKLQLDLADGEELRIRCGPYGNPLSSLFRAVFTPRRSIVVELDPRWDGPERRVADIAAGSEEVRRDTL